MQHAEKMMFIDLHNVYTDLLCECIWLLKSLRTKIRDQRNSSPLTIVRDLSSLLLLDQSHNKLPPAAEGEVERRLHETTAKMARFRRLQITRFQSDIERGQYFRPFCRDKRNPLPGLEYSCTQQKIQTPERLDSEQLRDPMRTLRTPMH